VVSSGANALGSGPEIMIAAGGLSGGLGSWATGGSFWDGVKQGIISSALNHAMHEGINNCCGNDPLWDIMEKAGYRRDIMTGNIYDPDGNLMPDVTWYEYLANLVSTAWLAAPFKALSSFFSKVAGKGGMSELQLVTKAAQKAEAAIGGSGGVSGTLKHSYAKNLLTRYQSRFGGDLSLGSNYFSGPAGRGF
jgi:hypothetical protein